MPTGLAGRVSQGLLPVVTRLLHTRGAGHLSSERPLREPPKPPPQDPALRAERAVAPSHGLAAWVEVGRRCCQANPQDPSTPAVRSSPEPGAPAQSLAWPRGGHVGPRDCHPARLSWRGQADPRPHGPGELVHSPPDPKSQVVVRMGDGSGVGGTEWRPLVLQSQQGRGQPLCSAPAEGACAAEDPCGAVASCDRLPSQPLSPGHLGAPLCHGVGTTPAPSVRCGPLAGTTRVFREAPDKCPCPVWWLPLASPCDRAVPVRASSQGEGVGLPSAELAVALRGQGRHCPGSWQGPGGAQSVPCAVCRRLPAVGTGPRGSPRSQGNRRARSSEAGGLPADPRGHWAPAQEESPHCETAWPSRSA